MPFIFVIWARQQLISRGLQAGLEDDTPDLSAPGPQAGARGSFVQILTPEGQNGTGP